MDELNQNQSNVPPAVSQSNPPAAPMTPDGSEQAEAPRKSKFWKFWLVTSLWALIFFVGMVVVAFTVGTGGHPPAGFLIAMALGVVLIQLILAIVIFSLVRRAVTSARKKIPNWIVGFVSTFFAIYVSHLIMPGVSEDFIEFLGVFVVQSFEIVYEYAVFAVVVSFLVLISVTVRLLKIETVPIWKASIVPAGRAFFLIILTFGVAIFSTNFLSFKAGKCDLVVWNKPLQINCYLRQAFKNGDVALCESKKLDRFITGDCVAGVAAYHRNVDMCYQLPEGTQDKLFSECVMRVAVLSGNGSLCDRVTDERYRKFCFTQPPLEDLLVAAEEQQSGLPFIERINKFLSGGDVSYVE